jgi:hypothetical protein
VVKALLPVAIETVPDQALCGAGRNTNNNQPMGVFAKLKQFKEKKLVQQAVGFSKYRNLGIVLGSAAEVEHVWSDADYHVLGKERRGIGSIQFCLKPGCS